MSAGQAHPDASTAEPSLRATASFSRAFGGQPTHCVRAPGRVNLIGEHTDYNDGFVLPCAIGFHTVVASRARGDGLVRVVASDCGEALDTFRADDAISPNPLLPWANYVRGVFAMLAARGIPLQGLDLAIAGNVPQGAGLSSSAALEVAVACTLRIQLGDAMSAFGQTDLALLAQEAENRFVGCQCGIMDQLISSGGVQGHALLIDCRDLTAHAVPLPPDMAVMVVESRIRRGLVDSAYNQRRAECRSAAQALGLASLRDAKMASLLALRGQAAFMDEVVWRRAHHVLSENARTLQAAQALADGDLPRMGLLMAQSHTSMRDDFEITVPAIDQLVAVLQDTIGAEGGARMTGGGFGGCVVALMPKSRVPDATRAVVQRYRSPQGEPATVHVTQAADGAGLLPLPNAADPNSQRC